MKETISVLIPEKEIDKRLNEMIETISSDFKGKTITIIGVLKGSVMLMVDIAKKLKQPVEFDFIDISSYGEGLTSSGNIKINKDIENSIEGKHVLLVEDIIDSGRTLNYLLNYLKSKKPASLKVCTLLDKPERRVFDINVNYIGFEIPDEFVVGYGLDYAQKYRNLPYIGTLEIEE